MQAMKRAGSGRTASTRQATSIPPKAKAKPDLHSLELQYNATIHACDMTVRDEEVRRARTNALLLQHEMESIRGQLDREVAQVSQLKSQLAERSLELEDAQRENQAKERKVQLALRDVASLKDQLSAVTHTAGDAAKTNAENARLSRELAQLQQELENMRAQLSHHQSAVSDKQAMERRLNSLEVELANERRNAAAQRESAAQGRSAVDEQMRQKLAEVEKLLEAQRRKRDREAKDEAKRAADDESKIEALERKIERMQGKLRSSQAELQTCRAELETAKRPTARASAIIPRPEKARGVATGPAAKKRRAAEMAAEPSILQTPDTIAKRQKRVAGKRSLLDATLVGEKSHFSITPFLNKTRSLNDSSLGDAESMTPGPAGANQLSMAEPAKEDSAAAHGPSPSMGRKPSVPLSERQANVLPVASSGTQKGMRALKKTTSLVAERSFKTTNLATMTLDIVPEEGAQPSTASPTQTTTSSLADKTASTQPTKTNTTGALSTKLTTKGGANLSAVSTQTARKKTAGEGEAKKKRKLASSLAATTLFDGEDDAEAIVATKTKPSASASAAGGGAVRARVQLMKTSSAFGGAAFSPLKKDRRAAKHSFLV